MSELADFNVWIAVVILVITAATWIRNKDQAVLTKKQIAQIDRSELEKTLPEISVRMFKSGTSYKIEIMNEKDGDSAFHLDLKIIKSEQAPLHTYIPRDMFPLPELKSGTRETFMVCPEFGIPNNQVVQLKWKKRNGESVNETYRISPE